MDLMKEKAELSLVYGSTWLSLHEATHLAPGDIIRTASPCGYPHALRLNGRWLCGAEVVVLGTNFGVRLTGLGAEPSAGGRPPVDEVLDLLPAELVLSTRAFAMEDLRGLTPGALIEFDQPFSETEDTQLWVAGCPVAAGRALVLGECFALRIARVFQGASPDLPSRVSFNRLERGMALGEPVKEYRWKQPDKFSRRQIGRLGQLHGLFLERAPFFHGAWNGWKLGQVDQCTFSEAMEAWKSPSRFAVLRMEALGISASRHVGPANAPRWLLLPDSPNRAGLERYMKANPDSGTGLASVEWNSLLIAHRPGSPLAAAMDAAIPEGVVAPLGDAWRNLAATELRFGRIADEPDSARIVPPNDMVITVEIARGEDRASLVYPYITLEPFLRYLE